MGYWSERQLEMTEGGMSLLGVENTSVCPSCFEDGTLQGRVRAIARPGVCTYCGQDDEGAARMEEVVRLINEAIHLEYANADGEVPFDKEEGVYLLAKTYDTDDVLDDIGLELPRDFDGRLRLDLIGALPEQIWSARDPLVAARHEAIASSWRTFCHVIKHERRFYFRDYAARDMAEDIAQREAAYAIPELLDEVAGYAHRAGLFTEAPVGTVYIRAMKREDPSAGSFGPRRMGPPPYDKARQPNRMSPAGIPMFYGAEDERTALLETTRAPGRFALGRFETQRALQLLDLRLPPPVPSLFDAVHARDRDFAVFMREFIADFRRPVEDTPEVEYVPTQVVTEYFRTVTHAKRPIDGVLYSSTRDDGKTAVVLFADTFDVEEPGAEPAWRRDPPWLKMIQYDEIDFDPAA